MGVVIRGGRPVPQDESSQVPVKRNWVNVEQELLHVTVDRLRLCLNEHLAKARRSRDWIAPVGVIVTVAATLAGSEFKDNLLTPDQWSGLFALILIASIVWLFLAARASRNPASVDDIILELTQGAHVEDSTSSQDVPPLAIRSARYGAGRVWANVTDVVRSKVSDGRLVVLASNEELGGDPTPNVKKTLCVDYTCGGRDASGAVSENEELRLP